MFRHANEHTALKRLEGDFTNRKKGWRCSLDRISKVYRYRHQKTKLKIKFHLYIGDFCHQKIKKYVTWGLESQKFYVFFPCNPMEPFISGVRPWSAHWWYKKCGSSLEVLCTGCNSSRLSTCPRCPWGSRGLASGDECCKGKHHLTWKLLMSYIQFWGVERGTIPLAKENCIWGAKNLPFPSLFFQNL